MSISNLPDANFTPTRGNYNNLKPFRFWCQKILPLVYDDSMSYYEVLAKLTGKLNEVIETFNDELPEQDICCVYLGDFLTTASKKFIELLEKHSK